MRRIGACTHPITRYNRVVSDALSMLESLICRNLHEVPRSLRGARQWSRHVTCSLRQQQRQDGYRCKPYNLVSSTALMTLDGSLSCRNKTVKAHRSAEPCEVTSSDITAPGNRATNKTLLLCASPVYVAVLRSLRARHSHDNLHSKVGQEDGTKVLHFHPTLRHSDHVNSCT
jgi:hypothetical protein